MNSWCIADVKETALLQNCKCSIHLSAAFVVGFAVKVIEGLHERTKHLNIFLFSAHHSMVFYF